MSAVLAPAVYAVRAREQAMLRFATGVTGAFVLGEFMGWVPSFLGGLLAAVLLSNLPGRPPFKVGVLLVLVMTVAALYSFALAWLLHLQPTVLFGVLLLHMFLCFHVMHQGKAVLPMILSLLCLATIPLVVLTIPALGDVLPTEMIRGIVVAILTVWAMFAIWPLPLPPPEKPAVPPASVPALTTALLSTAVVLPLLLGFLLLGITDAFPVLVSTVILVIKFDIRSSSKQAGAMVIGNFVGGVFALALHLLVLSTPSLVILALGLFLANIWFGQRIAAGGPAAGVAGIACNAMLIILSTGLLTGPGSFSVWATRLFQFVVAGAFAIGMMTVVWHATGNAQKQLATRRGG